MSFIPDLDKLEDLEFFHDEPDPVSDVFGYHFFCENLVSVIFKQEDTPFSILIHGEWGSGKTSVLVKTGELLEDLETKDENFKVILFEVWKYEKIDPVASLLEEIKNKIKGRNSEDFAKIAKSVGLLLFDIAIRAHTNLSLKEATEYFEESHRSIKDLRKQTEILMEGKKLVILFDDLDRCSFETMLELVEAMRLFLSVKGIICIVAADNDRLRAAWKNKYYTANENESDEYFDKIFQLKLALPSKDQTLVTNFITDLKPSYIGDTEKNLIKSCTSNPRKIKQILNLIFFSMKYSKLNKELLSQDKLKSYYPMIVTWSIIRVLYPQFGNSIKINTSSLNEILDFISQIKETETRFLKDAKQKIDEKKLTEDVFRKIKHFHDLDVNHYLKQKAGQMSIWSIECLEIIANDFELFLFCYGLLSYLGSVIDFTTARKDTDPSYLAIIEFVNDQVVDDVVKEINLF